MPDLGYNVTTAGANGNTLTTKQDGDNLVATVKNSGGTVVDTFTVARYPLTQKLLDLTDSLYRTFANVDAYRYANPTKQPSQATVDGLKVQTGPVTTACSITGTLLTVTCTNPQGPSKPLVRTQDISAIGVGNGGGVVTPPVTQKYSIVGNKSASDQTLYIDTMTASGITGRLVIAGTTYTANLSAPLNLGDNPNFGLDGKTIYLNENQNIDRLVISENSTTKEVTFYYTQYPSGSVIATYTFSFTPYAV